MGDRGGGREVKGASLKKSKKNPGASAAKMKTLPKAPNSGPAISLTPPAPGDEPYFDAGLALLSRQFDRDRDRVVSRAKSEGNCCGMLLWFADIEKQSTVSDFCKLNSGICYYSTGIHPDNIDRTNKKSHDDWLVKIDELGKKPECIALMSGLNLSREMGTHFAQESLLKSSCALAEKLSLPLVLHINDSTSLERAIEILRLEGWANGEDEEDSAIGHHRVLLHDAMTSCDGNTEVFKQAIQAGFHFVIAATGLTDPDDTIRDKATECVKLIPLDKLLVGTDSPWKTPQNLEDPYLRTLRNEPANIASIHKVISEVTGVEQGELTATVRANTLRVFGLEFLNASSATAAAALNAEGVEEITDKLEDTVLDNNDDNGAAATASEEKASQPSTKKGPSASGYYSCVKCRTKLFTFVDTHSHDLAAVKTVFKVGEEGLCASNVFLKVADNREISGRSGLAIRGGNVECKSCGQKLGKYAPAEAICACGVTLPGPVAKVNAAKIDFFDGSVPSTLLTLEELSKKAQQENEELQRQEQQREEEAEELRLLQGGKVKKVKKMKSENKGNFSSFRNKSFVPNASRSANTTGAAAGGGGGGGGKKTKINLELLQQGDSSDENSGEDDN